MACQCFSELVLYLFAVTPVVFESFLVSCYEMIFQVCLLHFLPQVWNQPFLLRNPCQVSGEMVLGDNLLGIGAFIATELFIVSYAFLVCRAKSGERVCCVKIKYNKCWVFILQFE